MRRRSIAALLAVVAVMSLALCSAAGAAEGDKVKLETNVLRWARDNSGNAFVAIALDKGWFDEIGLKIEEIPIDADADALAAIIAGQVDIFSNYGTSVPLQYIASGEDLTIIGGYMATGCTPIIAKKGTEWKGIRSFVGKKVASSPSSYSFTGPLLELGYDPLKDVEWVTLRTSSDGIAAVEAGEVDFAAVGTSRNYEISRLDNIEVMAYTSDIMPYYSCCRMVTTTDFLKKHPNTIKQLMKILLRAQCYYENHREESMELMARNLAVPLDYVKAYMPNEHFRISVDPLKNQVVRGWNILDKTGFLSENAKNIKLEDHLDTSYYQEALAMAKAEYYDEDPKFYDRMEKFFAEYNQ